MTQIRVRFAPSPTGMFHLGSARTALFNWLYARHCNGVFILRIEDTDRDRNTDEALKLILHCLTWLGLNWDEGPEAGGAYGPYFQSQRGQIYAEHVEQLKAAGRAYEKDGAVWFRVSGQPQEIHDQIRGKVVRLEPKDFVIVRSNGSPGFHFVNVVDDLTMSVTHVIRGEDHLSNTSKHIELFKALDAPIPRYAHIPLILKHHGPGKMSKRDEGFLVADYERRLFLPEALRNYLCLLGWSPKDEQEVMDIAEIIERFDFPGINKDGARFDERKLSFINAEYLRKLPVKTLSEVARPVLEQKLDLSHVETAYFHSVLDLCQEKLRSIDDIYAYLGYFFEEDFSYGEQAGRKLRSNGDPCARIRELWSSLAELPDFSDETAVEGTVKRLAAENDRYTGEYIHSARFALSGMNAGPSFYGLLRVLGRDRTCVRFDRFLKLSERNHSEPVATDFIRDAVFEYRAAGNNRPRVQTRFPPEPSGYLHVGHAKAIALNFGVAEEFGGLCNLRFDDTNPQKEETEYVDAIMEDIRWLQYNWGERPYFASDYFGQLYEFARTLIRNGNAYVCDLNADEVREYRGTLTSPGRDSPFRERSQEENLDLFARMRRGEFSEGERTLRAKIDMASHNLNLRDPVIYRIQKRSHHRTGDTWCIYPLYDFAHGQSDAIEKVTHSLCSMEFEAHRPLYDWFIRELGIFPSRQFEFARFNLTYCVMQKRKLRRLVEEGYVDGWDDPRMITLCGMRRRGYTPEAIRDFLARIGITKRPTTIEMELLEHCLRDDLNRRAPRIMGVLRPLKVVIENYGPEDEETFEAINNPEDSAAGVRKVPFCRELYIERDDFRVDPPRKFFRLAPGREVRLRYACYITCNEVIHDAEGKVVELRCSYDPASRGGSSPDGRRVRGTLHWVSARHAIKAEVRLFDRLFRERFPEDQGNDFVEHLNPDSREIIPECCVEPSLAGAAPGYRFQFERLGYFCVDRDSLANRMVLNRTITLRDSWAKLERARQTPSGSR